MGGVENLVAVHHRNKVLRVGEVDDVMRIAREHVDAFYLFPTHLKLQHLIRTYLALLYQTMSAHHNEKLPFRIMPVLPLRDARLRDIDTHLTTVQRMHQLREGTAVIHIHLQRERDFLFRQITEIG